MTDYNPQKITKQITLHLTSREVTPCSFYEDLFPQDDIGGPWVVIPETGIVITKDENFDRTNTKGWSNEIAEVYAKEHGGLYFPQRCYSEDMRRESEEIPEYSFANFVTAMKSLAPNIKHLKRQQVFDPNDQEVYSPLEKEAQFMSTFQTKRISRHSETEKCVYRIYNPVEAIVGRLNTKSLEKSLQNIINQNNYNIYITLIPSIDFGRKNFYIIAKGVEARLNSYLLEKKEQPDKGDLFQAMQSYAQSKKVEFEIDAKVDKYNSLIVHSQTPEDSRLVRGSNGQFIGDREKPISTEQLLRSVITTANGIVEGLVEYRKIQRIKDSERKAQFRAMFE